MKPFKEVLETMVRGLDDDDLMTLVQVLKEEALKRAQTAKLMREGKLS